VETLPGIVVQYSPMLQYLSQDHNGRRMANIERIQLNIYTEIIYGLRVKESERSISRDLGISRPVVHKYQLKTLLVGKLDNPQKFPGREKFVPESGKNSRPVRLFSR
jgi:hypothetical protein